ncbi:MAG: translesion DNA synthesis-associated protein ImuA [Paucibacter sp.]|nr:translesion DNA synthesis-associated protein ImuA [Roseateles sp.]
MHSAIPSPTLTPRGAIALPPEVYRADGLDGSRPGLPSGFARLDAELPGGGWLLGGLNEILVELPGALEWRLLTPLLSNRRDRPVLLIAPPHLPHLPGLSSGPLLLIQPQTPQLRLWALEQAIRSGDGGAVLAWLPEIRDARPEQIRRLQAHALASHVPIFVFRPQAAAAQSSAAPLRVQLRAREPWQIEAHIHKRRGPAHEGWLALDATPTQLEPLLTPRMRTARLPQRTVHHVVARAPSLAGH